MCQQTSERFFIPPARSQMLQVVPTEKCIMCPLIRAATSIWSYKSKSAWSQCKKHRHHLENEHTFVPTTILASTYAHDYGQSKWLNEQAPQSPMFETMKSWSIYLFLSMEGNILLVYENPSGLRASLISWVWLEKSKQLKLGCEQHFCRVT
jgi:hypothetical protein